MQTPLPVARTDDLIVLDVDEETLAYDLIRHRVHCLNRIAAIVWGMCDGKTGIDRMTTAVSTATGAPPDRDMVWYALRRLNGARLLANPLRPEAVERVVSRRELLRRISTSGLGLFILPTVATIIAPSTLQAQASCLPSGANCSRTMGLPCCAGPCRGQPPGADLGTCP